jgi:hypothetical protein
MLRWFYVAPNLLVEAGAARGAFSVATSGRSSSRRRSATGCHAPVCPGAPGYIAPGAPWENAYSESLNSRLRDGLLNRELFTSVLEAKVVTEDYRQEYNQRRPHSALGYQTPAAFAGRCRSLGALPPNPRLLPLRRAPEEKPVEDPKLGPTLIATGSNTSPVCNIF